MSLSKFSLLRAKALSSTLKSMGLFKESSDVLSIFKISQDVGEVIDQNSHILFIFEEDFLGDVNALAKKISGSEEGVNISNDTRNAVYTRFRAFKTKGTYSIPSGTIFTIKKTTIEAINNSSSASEEAEEAPDPKIVPEARYENKLINISSDFTAPTSNVTSTYGKTRSSGGDHTGIDYGIPLGGDILSVYGGIVKRIKKGGAPAYMDDDKKVFAGKVLYPSNDNQKYKNDKLTVAANNTEWKYTKIGDKMYSRADAQDKINSLSGGSLGNLVEIYHGIAERKDERYLISSLYAHLDEVSVSNNDIVGSSTKIGTCGVTGRVTGPHLHLEIRGHKLKNQDANPVSFQDLLSLETVGYPVKDFAKSMPQ